MRRVLPALLVPLGACAPEIPEPCAEMCLDAATLYGGCVAGWGLDWPAVGYDDAAAFVHSCETWAWEARRLTRDEPDWLARTCAERQAAFAAPEATCDTYTRVDWARIGGSP